MFIRFLATATFAVLASPATTLAASHVIDPGSQSGARDLGLAPASVRVSIAVVLNGRHGADLDRLVDAQADPKSPVYHQFLTQRQFRNYFAPASTEDARVIRALKRAGFTIANAAADGFVIDASAPAPVAARYFNTEIHRVLSPDAGFTYTNVRPGIVPADISGIVESVFGLDATHTFHAGPRRAVAGATRTFRNGIRRNGVPLFGPDGGYGPQIFTNVYDLPAASGVTGNGRASGVGIDGDFLDTDLAAYLAYFGVARTGPTTTRVAVDGGAPAFPGGEAFEATIDVETLVSLAPGTALYIYEVPALHDAAVVDLFNQVVSDDVVDSLNSSWAGWETQGSGVLARELDSIERRGSAEGITFHSSAGDQGVHCWCGPHCFTRKITVCLPADGPHNVAVGGTTLLVNPQDGEETSEVGWDQAGQDTATGGGVSVLFRLPAYQRDVRHIIAGGRNVPDITFDGDPLTGESNYFNGGFDGPIGGTSLSSPIFGAALAQINQIQSSRSGYFNPALYSTWLSNGYGSGSTLYFRDIVQGSIPPYYAQPGYDQMSGIGAMQVNNFAGLLGP